MPKRIYLDGGNINTEEIDQILRLGARISLSAEAKKRVKKCGKEFVKSIDSKNISIDIPGIPAEWADEVEEEKFSPRNIIASLSPGAGDLEPVRSVRAAMLCKANSLARGSTPIRLRTLETLIKLINRGVTPTVHEYTSIDNEGDSSALAEVTALLLGNGEAIYRGELMPGALALKKASIKPIDLEKWEIKGLISGPFLSMGNIILNLKDAEVAIKNELIASAMSLGTIAYDLHESMTSTGNKATTTTKTIEIISKIIGEPRSKQATKTTHTAAFENSFEVTPIVEIIASAIDAFIYSRDRIAAEIGAAQSSPVFDLSRKILSTGKNPNWHSLEPTLSLLNHALCNMIAVSSHNTDTAIRKTVKKDSNLKNIKENFLFLTSMKTLSQSISAKCCSIVLPHSAIGCNRISAEEMHLVPGLSAIKILRNTIDSLKVASSIEMLVSSQIIDGRSRRVARRIRSLHRSIRKVISPFSMIKPLHENINTMADLLEEGYLLKKAEKLSGSIDL